MKVGCKERGAADLCHEMLRDGPRQSEAVVGAGPPPQLVYDDQGLAACALQATHPPIKQLICSPLQEPLTQRVRTTQIM